MLPSDEARVCRANGCGASRHGKARRRYRSRGIERRSKVERPASVSEHLAETPPPAASAPRSRRSTVATSATLVPAPRRIALVRLSHLGDVVLALPLFHALRERFPHAELAWVVQPEFAPLVAALPGLARTIRFDRRAGLRGWLELRRELSEFAPDLAVDAQGNLKSGFALACSGAARRVGLARADWREPLGRFALTESAARAAGEHAFERTRALCRHFGLH